MTTTTAKKYRLVSKVLPSKTVKKTVFTGSPNTPSNVLQNTAPDPHQIQMFSNNREISIGKLYDAYKEGKLFMRPVAEGGGPSFQRLPHKPRGWKIYLVHSIFSGTPLPSIFVYEKEGIFFVTDGQQRLSAIFEFMEDEIKLTAKGMAERQVESLLPYLDNKKFSDLHPYTQDNFRNYKIRVESLESHDEGRIMLVYNRLNSGTKNMSPAELKASTYRGPIISAAFKIQEDLGFTYPQPSDLKITKTHMKDYILMDMGVVSKTDVLRMNDLEFIMELMMALYEQDVHDKKKGLETFCRNTENPLSEASISQIISSFTENILILGKIFSCYVDSAHPSQEKPDTWEEVKKTEWSKKHDFYSLFVAIDKLRREGGISYEDDLTTQGHNLVLLSMATNSKAREMKGVTESRLTYLAVNKSLQLGVVPLVKQYAQSKTQDWNFKSQRARRRDIIVEILKKTRKIAKV